jgi:hypothetical protein
MATRSNAQQNVLLDLNAPSFQRNLLSLDKTLRNEALSTLQKIIQMDWNQVYRDQGLKWEKIYTIDPPQGVEAIYSLRITQSRRAVAYRKGNFMCFIAIPPDHDAAYGKK